MSDTLTLRDAIHRFARCVRAVEDGATFVITRNGRRVARLVPMPEEAALVRLRAHGLRLGDRRGSPGSRRSA